MERTRLLRAIAILRSGGVVAYPTDTLYGLAVDPRSTRAVERLFEIKKREPGKAVPLIAASVEQASEAAVFDERARHVAESFWPGALSIVLQARTVVRSEILAADGSVAVRVPAHPISQALAAGF